MSQIMDIGGIRDRSQQCILDCWWKDQRFDYNVGGELIYRGAHSEPSADVGDANWAVWKLTYVSGAITRIEGPLVGSWTGRAALSW